MVVSPEAQIFLHQVRGFLTCACERIRGKGEVFTSTSKSRKKKTVTGKCHPILSPQETLSIVSIMVNLQ